MRQLLDNHFAPVTLAIGFIEADMERVCDFMRSWRNSINRKQHIRSLLGTLPEMLSDFQPLTHPESKELLVRTRSSWTALFTNSSHTPNFAGVVSHVSLGIGARGVLASWVPSTSDDSGIARLHGSVQMAVFSATATDFLNYDRAIGAFNEDGKWKFVLSGRQQPFERAAEYRNRLVKDRFTPQLLADYCSALGIEVFSGDFYGDEGILIEEDGPFITESVTYEEAQRKLAIASPDEARPRISTQRS